MGGRENPPKRQHQQHDPLSGQMGRLSTRWGHLGTHYESWQLPACNPQVLAFSKRITKVCSQEEQKKEIT